MKFFIGVTDNDWFNFLSRENREDINFWQPGGNASFKAILPGSPFLFKLKRPMNAIAGVGFFSSHTFLQLSMAWEIFGERNGCRTFSELQRMIIPLRKDKINLNPTIGCIILTNPIFFAKEDWIQVPDDWSRNIVTGKTYSAEEQRGRELWERVRILLEKQLSSVVPEEKSQLLLDDPTLKYGNPVLTKVRLGQSAFRILVTDAYSRKCSISGERTLPVLEAAHIKPYALSGPHFISNALLLRSDLHKLFDTGYITVTSGLRVEVSKRIKEEFENGKEYYRFHGAKLLNLPIRGIDSPEPNFVSWHNENVFKS